MTKREESLGIYCVVHPHLSDDFPASIETLSSKTGISKQKLQALLPLLADVGIVGMHYRRIGGRLKAFFTRKEHGR